MSVLTAEIEPAVAARPELPPSMVERMTLILDAFDGRSTRLTLKTWRGAPIFPGQRRIGSSTSWCV